MCSFTQGKFKLWKFWISPHRVSSVSGAVVCLDYPPKSLVVMAPPWTHERALPFPGYQAPGRWGSQSRTLQADASLAILLVSRTLGPLILGQPIAASCAGALFQGGNVLCSRAPPFKGVHLHAAFAICHHPVGSLHPPAFPQYVKGIWGHGTWCSQSHGQESKEASPPCRLPASSLLPRG